MFHNPAESAANGNSGGKSNYWPGLCSTHESGVKFNSILTQMSRVRVESAVKIKDMSRVRVESRQWRRYVATIGERGPFEVDFFHAPPIGITLNAEKFAGDWSLPSPPPPVPPPMNHADRYLSQN